MINNNRPDNVSFTENRVCHCKTGIKRAACFFMIFAAVSLSGCNGNKNADNIQNAQSVNESNQNVPNTTAQTGSEENANVPNENAQNATAQTENIVDVRDNSADEDYDFTTFYSFIPYGDGSLKTTAYAENLQYNKLERMSKISADILKIGFADEANKAGYPGMLEKIEEINKSRFIHWESAASVISEKISKAGDEERRKMYDESPYYDISRVAVVRSDERIFSLISTDESYMGEEERFTVQTANIDPVTGEEVDFNDLCTNRELLLQFAEKAAADHFSGDGISDNNETEKFMTEFNEMLSSGNVPFVIGNGGIGFYFGGQKPWSFFVDFSDGAC